MRRAAKRSSWQTRRRRRRRRRGGLRPTTAESLNVLVGAQWTYEPRRRTSGRSQRVAPGVCQSIASAFASDLPVSCKLPVEGVGP